MTIFFPSDFDNFFDALLGLVSISMLIQVGQLSNPELRRITDAATTARFRGEFVVFLTFFARGIMIEMYCLQRVFKFKSL